MTREWIRSGFPLAVGTVMVGFWGMLFLVGQVPEVQSAPIELGYHLAAELLTALGLIVAGVGRRWRRGWGYRLYPVALGMLGYTVINSAGYYAQRGEVEMVGLFGVLTVVTGMLLVEYLRDPAERP